METDLDETSHEQFTTGDPPRDSDGYPLSGDELVRLVAEMVD